jgi:hypothetical protein
MLPLRHNIRTSPLPKFTAPFGRRRRSLLVVSRRNYYRQPTLKPLTSNPQTEPSPAARNRISVKPALLRRKVYAAEIRGANGRVFPTVAAGS